MEPPRRIKFVFNNIAHKHIAGVYKISFGKRFYVGSSMWISRRMGSHSSMLNRLLKTHHFTVANEYYCHIYYYLMDHPEITEAVVTLIEEYNGRSQYELFEIEKKWTGKLGIDGECLNTTQLQYLDFEAHPEYLLLLTNGR